MELLMSIEDYLEYDRVQRWQAHNSSDLGDYVLEQPISQFEELAAVLEWMDSCFTIWYWKFQLTLSGYKVILSVNDSAEFALLKLRFG